ncbi:5-hydroxymethyl-dUMP N-hydrolase-like [Liolophura sinensis]|uniref:5-hydroxymethyl-dUMP N-hydrolase-like n=1 Tax=Liolophura sinensis TaxID=3198878 RepID=UPI00315941D9
MGLFIYFCGSIRGGRQDAELYQRLIEKLKAYGDVLTEHVGNPNVDDDEEKLTDREIYERDMKWLDQCDVVVAEVTQPSLGVGIELGKALSLGKKILCLFRPSSDKRLSALVSGAHDDEKFIVKDYKEKEVDDILKDFLGKKMGKNTTAGGPEGSIGM